MRILIVEDDPFKLNRLLSETVQLRSKGRTRSVTSLQQAMSVLESETFDVVLLDMAIPSHDSAAGSSDVYSQPVGGLDILLNLALSGRPEKVIVITQYPTVELNREHVPLSRLIGHLEKEDVFNVKGVILFSEDRPWQSQLRTLLEGAE